MHSFELLVNQFEEKFSKRHFPDQPTTLYDPNEYFLRLGGKRIRPVLCLMGNELFDNLHKDVWHVAAAIELFHNFTLIHDDIMDKAPLRRGMQTVHEKFGVNTALLSGDVMMIAAYENLNKVESTLLPSILQLFNKIAKKVCEGQQQDMDFEKIENINYDLYVNMIELKTSVLMAASLKMGAILGGASERNQNLLYEFGKKLGIAFQIQDDYLDAFGDPQKVGKQVGGDIFANKKTFLLIKALEIADENQKAILVNNQQTDIAGVNEILSIFKICKVDEWALQLKNKYMQEAFAHLQEIAVLEVRKKHLIDLANNLLHRKF